MIRSMTAFASGERATPWGLLGCELRSVNHRFLETGLRLADELRALEPVLRERVAARIQRGKLDLVMRLRAPEAAVSLAVNEPLLERLGDVSVAEKAFVQQELAAPVDVEGLVAQIPEGMEAQAYTMAVMAIDLDAQTEAQYLHALATALGLEPVEVNHIHDRLGAPKLYA